MKNTFNFDKYGIKYQFPERRCKNCKLYPCRDDIDVLDVDFARYGCIHYDE